MDTIQHCRKNIKRDRVEPIHFSNSAIKKLSSQLIDWYQQHGRQTLPWKQKHDPYWVWLSEIMLQQTQVKTVIPYFLNFIKHFPNIKKLAKAKEDEVLHLWTGLGYYQRARNLLRAAQKIVSHHQGIFPHDLESIINLPGIGRSTAGAIISMGFKQSAPILDGNVKRVLSRLYGVEAPIDDKKTLDFLWEKAEQLTPKPDASQYTQAIMDLGATLCKRSNPLCETCPWQKRCIAYQYQKTDCIPQKKSAKPKPVRSISWIILKNKNDILFQKRLEKNVWQHLWSFPEIQKNSPEKNLLKQFCKAHQLEFINAKHKAAFRHTFTHYHLDISPIIIETQAKKNKIRFSDAHNTWVSLQNTPNFGTPKPALQLWMELQNEQNHFLPKTQT